MDRRFLWLFFFCATLCAERGEDCWLGPVTRVGIGTRQGEGIGYDEGYSSIDLFVTPNWIRTFQPFADARGHVFNDGQFALNLGLGGRWLTEWDWAFGANAYYDFRSMKALSPHQIGGGIELLSRWLDVRLNGYFPVADTERKGPARFVRFQGNNGVISRRLSAAYSVISGEVGVPLRGFLEPAGLYLAVGPYYIFRKDVDQFNFGNAFGGEVRLNAQILDGVDIGGHFSYDSLFDGRLNGYVKVTLPYGPVAFKEVRRGWKRRWPGEDCSKFARRQRLATQPVVRHEIIPMKEKKIESLGLDPLTGEAISIVFVNSQAIISGIGTFELPFMSLAEAEAGSGPGQMILLEGTLEGAIALQEGQRLQGAGATWLIEDARVPVETGRAVVRSAAPYAVRVGSGNSVSGIVIENREGWALDLRDAQDFHISGVVVCGGINCDGAGGGLKVIEGCEFYPVKGYPSIQMKELEGSRVQIAGNTFYGVERAVEFGGNSQYEIVDNHFDRVGYGMSGGGGFVRIHGNQLGVHGVGIALEGEMRAQIENNLIVGCDASVKGIVAEGNMDLLLINNSLQDANIVIKVKKGGGNMLLRAVDNWNNGTLTLMNLSNNPRALRVDALNFAPSGVEALNYSGKVVVPFEPIEYRPVHDHARVFTPYRGMDEE